MFTSPQFHIFHIGFFRLIAISKAGKKIKFVSVAITRVSEVSQPSACVPPKPLKQKITNPAIRTRDVYTILIPVE